MEGEAIKEEMFCRFFVLNSPRVVGGEYVDLTFLMFLSIL